MHIWQVSHGEIGNPPPLNIKMDKYIASSSYTETPTNLNRFLYSVKIFCFCVVHNRKPTYFSCVCACHCPIPLADRSSSLSALAGNWREVAVIKFYILHRCQICIATRQACSCCSSVPGTGLVVCLFY